MLSWESLSQANDVHALAAVHDVVVCRALYKLSKSCRFHTRKSRAVRQARGGKGRGRGPFTRLDTAIGRSYRVDERVLDFMRSVKMHV